jgi:hypothetical protein
VAIVCYLLMVAGCLPTESSRTTHGPRIDPFDTIKTDVLSESWDAYYLGQAKVGHRQRVVSTFHHQGQDLRRIMSIDQLELKRFGSHNTQTLTQISIEQSDGQVISLGYEVKTQESTQRGVGYVEAGHLLLQYETGSSKYERRIPFAHSRASIFAIENSLSGQPMKPAETRDVNTFRPLVDRVASVHLRAEQYEETPVSEGSRRLLKIVVTEDASDGWPTMTSIWTDERGVIWKTADPFLDRSSHRVTRSQALSTNDFLATDLGLDTGVPLTANFPRAAETVSARYHVRLRDLVASTVFSSSLGQDVATQNDGTTCITVRRVSPTEPASPPRPPVEPTEADRRPNALINCDHRRITALAEAIAGNDSDPWRVAKAVERHLHILLKKNTFSQVFDSASTVAEKKSGDCSEHAVLLAAVCRALRIPARVVVGLVYSEPDRRFLFHMWNEVWIKDRWIPLDATVGKGWVAADHIKFRDSSLSGQSAYGVVAPVAAIAGRLNIELGRVEREP